MTGCTKQKTIPKPEESKIAKDDFVSKSATKFMKSRACIPPLNNTKSNSIKSFTSIHMTPNGAAWTRFVLNRAENSGECANITHWGHYHLDMHKMHLIDITQIYLRMNRLIPDSDAYVMEDSSTRMTYQKNGNLPMQQAQSVALLTGLLSYRTANATNGSGPDVDGNVYFISRNISGR